MDNPVATIFAEILVTAMFFGFLRLGYIVVVCCYLAQVDMDRPVSHKRKAHIVAMCFCLLCFCVFVPLTCILFLNVDMYLRDFLIALTLIFGFGCYSNGKKIHEYMGMTDSNSGTKLQNKFHQLMIHLASPQSLTV